LQTKTLLKMEFTHAQMSEIISSIANGKEGFKELIHLGMESLMKSERTIQIKNIMQISWCWNAITVALRCLRC
jgi:hypothetical protein